MTERTSPAPDVPARLGRILEALSRMADETQAGAPRPTGEPVVVRAPGRVNLIGEYTDINEGYVLPAAIDLEVWLAFRPTDGREVTLRSEQLDETASFALDGLSAEKAIRGWIGYVAGTAWSLQDAGLRTRGIVGVLDSTVPVGAGLSSSAAIEMASSWALHDPAEPRPAPPQMALLAQRAENRYVGVNSGIMDQFASAAGRRGNALLIDCRSLDVAYAPISEDLSIVVCDTASPHKLESSAYNERRRECEEATRIIAEREPGVRALRDVSVEMFERARSRLPEIVARRADHVVHENERVLEAVEALRTDDRDAIGRLFAASHASLRDLFAVTSPELDALVEIAYGVPGVVGARMTGGGFGGCTVNLVERGAEERLEAAVARRYPEVTGLTPRVYRVSAVDGAGMVAGQGGSAASGASARAGAPGAPGATGAAGAPEESR